LKLIPALLLCLLLFAVPANAQQPMPVHLSLKLPRTDSSLNITLQVFSLPDSALKISRVVKSKSTDFNLGPSGKYLLRLSSVNYEKTERVINMTGKPVYLAIELRSSSTTLQNVVVVSRKPLMKQEDDKTIVDATVLANSSTNAMEVMEKTPGLIIDQDGNIYLNSMTPATVYINGREMKLSSADIASLLKSLPAGSVSKIEILRNPSAKYDAASSGGIVNVVLKKGVKLGSNGTVNAGYFQGVYATETAGFNLNNNSGKLNSYLNYQFTNRNNFEELNSDRYISTDSSLLKQRAYTRYPSLSNYLGGGLDYAFTEKFNIAYDLRINQSANKSDAGNSNDLVKLPSQFSLSNSQSDVNNNTHSLYIGNELSSKYKIDSAGSEWETELNYNFYDTRNKQDYLNRFNLPVKHPNSGDGEIQNRKNIFVFKSDLTLKWPKLLTLEAGFKATFSNSRNSTNYFADTGTTGRHPDLFQTNTFRYKETITAAYLQVSRTQWGFTLKPGLRLETTDIRGRQVFPKDTSLSIRRTDLFPYVFLSHRLFKIFGVQLIGNAIYRRSIRRPYYELLNPFPKYIDPYLYDVGNPRLSPQFTTNYELNATYDNFPVLALGINVTKNIFSNVTYQDNLTKIAYRTYDNLGKSKEYYFRVIGGLPPGGKYFIYAGVQYNYNEFRGIYQNSPLDYKRGSWLFFMYQELKATKTLTLSMQGFMRTKALQNFYELNTFGGLFLSANKSILKKKANVILSFNDILRTNHVTFKLNQGTISASGSRFNDTRRIGITLRYNFGLNKQKENKEFGAPVEGN